MKHFLFLLTEIVVGGFEITKIQTEKKRTLKKKSERKRLSTINNKSVPIFSEHQLNTCVNFNTDKTIDKTTQILMMYSWKS